MVQSYVKITVNYGMVSGKFMYNAEIHHKRAAIFLVDLISSMFSFAQWIMFSTKGRKE